jgi:hypothetical protein
MKFDGMIGVLVSLSLVDAIDVTDVAFDPLLRV